jgi:exopolyphosphatase/pppGpp-phosphohydrolase
MGTQEASTRRTDSTQPRARVSPPLAATAGSLRDARFEAIARFVGKHLGDSRHERRVATLATRVFNLTIPWHPLGRRDLVALRLGALLHDIGRHHDDDLHPEIGAEIIRTTRHLPLTPRERRLAAYLARYHRGAVPPPRPDGHDDILLPGDHAKASLLLAMLRAADGLDSRVSGGVDVTFLRQGQRLTIRARPHNPTAKARKSLARRKKFRLLESLLGCDVRVKVA